MRRTIFFLLFALHTMLFGLEPITLKIGDTSATYCREYLNLFDDISEFQSAVVFRVVDGDTVKLKLKSDLDSLLTARLIGVDTPESVHPQKSVEHFGIESSDFTKVVLEGKDFFLSLFASLILTGDFDCMINWFSKFSCLWISIDH